MDCQCGHQYYRGVAEFIVQMETAAHTEEALTILKKWNPTSN